MTEFVVVLITASGEDEAAAIAHALVETRLAACVNIVKGIRSIYRWQGRVEDESEALMIVKGRRDALDDIITTVRQHHSYSVPEIIALPLVAGSGDYLDWLGRETR